MVFTGGMGPASAQGWTDGSCPQLATIEMTRQRLETLREQREAGIDRLPTSQHQRLALESLYRWYWPNLARLENDRIQAEANCRASQLRQDSPLTRASPLPEPLPAQPDPFRPPIAPPYAPPAAAPPTAMYPPYARRTPPDGPDPFDGYYAGRPGWTAPAPVRRQPTLMYPPIRTPWGVYPSNPPWNR
jgi:hypothetical protein